MAVTIRPSIRKGKFMVEMDANRLERLASLFGLYNPEFLVSLNKSLQQEKEGKLKKLRSLKDLR